VYIFLRIIGRLSYLLFSCWFVYSQLGHQRLGRVLVFGKTFGESDVFVCWSCTLHFCSQFTWRMIDHCCLRWTDANTGSTLQVCRRPASSLCFIMKDFHHCSELFTVLSTLPLHSCCTKWSWWMISVIKV